ncbi:hypothetical protein B0H14DRAFT_3872181 [Mycena olivaceomarginata]|nr:hypothetical protein B0H14DRAFT_3872181 [Mycena olivaceomarginata]
MPTSSSTSHTVPVDVDYKAATSSSATGVGRACYDSDTKENKRYGESTVTGRTVKKPKIDPVSNSMGRQIGRRTRPFPTHSRKKDHETYTKMVHPTLEEALNHAAIHNAFLK